VSVDAHDDDLILGWCTDPFGVHEQRWISTGVPTALVRDGSDESKDPPPSDREPMRPFVPIDTTFGWSDARRAGQASGSLPRCDYDTVAMDANVLFGSTATPNGIAPSDGRPVSGWATSFEIKMRRRARKQRRAERWRRWFGPRS